MKLPRIFLALIVAVLWAAHPAAAQQQDKDAPKTPTARFGDPTTMAPQYQDYLYGVIKEVHPGSMLLTKTQFGTDQEFKFTKKTKVVEDGKASSIGRLKVGDKVWVAVDKSKKTGDMIAKRVVAGTDIPAVP